ncbi:mannose-1-phosphate guanyltransferase alpha-like isoform X2 [Rhopilema esculentum]|uniref:mannose-1-phosphate guanyltransferase alpha-like isoform X2 n=1 Tax=Rhopilema esculentum TaxID=499914 RepID=UPI0031DF60DD|eukprot:gene13351-4201_t
MAGQKGPVKAVIVVGGPQKGTRFRPLSFDVPKPLFPVAGVPLIQHHLEACTKVEGLTEIILLGYYQSNEHIAKFIEEMKKEFNIPIRYLQEYDPLGTGGGLYLFRDQIQAGNPEAIIVIHSDIFCIPPLNDMLDFFRRINAEECGKFVILGTQAAPTQTSDLGNIVVDPCTLEVLHYVEKPENYVSSIVNCGVYIFDQGIFQSLGDVFQKKSTTVNDDGPSANPASMMLGKDICSPLAGQGKVFLHLMKNAFWGSMKSAGSAIYASRQFLASYRKHHQERLVESAGGKATILGDVFIHPSATVHPTAKIGPNVTIGKDCRIGPGARVRESIILDGAEIDSHSCVLFSIVGWKCYVGAWSRVEGTPQEPCANFPHALVPNESLFLSDGKLIPSITVLGCNVTTMSGSIILNSIVLPHKELSTSYKNEIIL